MGNKKRMYKKGSFLEPNKELTFGGPNKMQGGGAAYPTYEKSSDKAKSFREAFAAARKAGKMTFEWDGRKYGTRRADENKEQHAAAMKKASGSGSEAKPKAKAPAPGTKPPGTPKKEAPARTTPSGGSGMGAKQREDALKAEIDSAKPKAKATPAPKKTGASNVLKQSEFQSKKGAMESSNTASAVAKVSGAKKATKADTGASGDASARKALKKKYTPAKPTDRRVAKKEARASKKEDKALVKKADKTFRKEQRADRKTARNEKKLDRKARRYDRRIDSTTGLNRRQTKKANAASAASAAAARKKAVGDAVEKDLKSKGIMQAAGLRDPKPNQKGLRKLPTAVRNRMGYKMFGGYKKK